MDIVISNTSGKPIYQQIYEQLRGQIIRGELRADEALPPIRTVAKELRISVITVKKAWEELEQGGFIYSMVGRGTFVAPHPQDAAERRDALALEKLQRDVEEYKSLGLTKAELLRLIERIYGEKE